MSCGDQNTPHCFHDTGFSALARVRPYSAHRELGVQVTPAPLGIPGLTDVLELVKWEQGPDLVTFLVSTTVFLTSRKGIYIYKFNN